MKPMFQTAGIAMALLTALPVAAQTAAPAAPPAPAMGGMHAGPNPGAGKRAMRLQMFNSLSPAGQAVMREAMKAGDSVTFTGFGSFKVTQRAARKGRNPRTGKEINIPAGKAVKFTPGKALKESVK